MMKGTKHTAACLALAVVLLVGVLAPGAMAAEFTDGDQIVHREAVELLAELNVFQGKDDGSFAPGDGITRGEAAKLLVLLRNGGKNPQLAAAQLTSTDTQGHWAAPYIEFCLQSGYMEGRADGTFAPNDPVTARELAQSLLILLGYDPETEAKIGDTWDTQADLLAEVAGLYDGVAWDTALTRDQAARMIFTSLTATMVRYDAVLMTGADQQLSAKYIRMAKDGESLLRNNFGKALVDGKLTAD